MLLLNDMAAQACMLGQCSPKEARMAGNFNISISKKRGQIRLKLNGDFDGSAACELTNLINSRDLPGNSKILVDTDALKHIHP
jgi:hypothetical protein